MVVSTIQPEGFSERWLIFQNAQDLVDEKFEYGRDYASNAFQIANETIQKLSDLSSSLNGIDTNVTLESITAPSIDTFVTSIPTSPSITMNLPSDIDQGSDLDNAVKAKILGDIQSESAAIPDAVVTAITDKDAERALLLLQDDMDRISDEWSRRGFTLPDMFLGYLLAQVSTDYRNKRLDVSRDITIENFKLTDANMKFAIEKGIQWYANKIEVYKSKVQSEISRVDALVRKFIAEVQVYATSADVYRSQVMTNISLFDAQVRAALGRAELLIKNADVEMRNYEAINGLKMKSMESISGVAAQLIAGALSSVSAGVSLSASNAASYGYSSNWASEVQEEAQG